MFIILSLRVLVGKLHKHLICFILPAHLSAMDVTCAHIVVDEEDVFVLPVKEMITPRFLNSSPMGIVKYILGGTSFEDPKYFNAIEHYAPGDDDFSFISDALTDYNVSTYELIDLIYLIYGTSKDGQRLIKFVHNFWVR